MGDHINTAYGIYKYMEVEPEIRYVNGVKCVIPVDPETGKYKILAQDKEGNLFIVSEEEAKEKHLAPYGYTVVEGLEIYQ